MTSRCLLVGLVLVALVARTRADEPLDGPKHVVQDDLLDRLVGTWKMEGTVRGNRTEHTAEAHWVLNHQFLVFHETAVTRSPDQPPYEALVYIGFDNTSERYVVHWIDVFGGRFSETLGYGARTGDTIQLVFEYPDGPFRTTFAWNAADRSWQLHGRTKTAKGAWVDFMGFTLAPRKR